MAWASACATIQDRPVLGRINFNIYYLSNLTATSNSDFEGLVDTTIHEITHVLGFSSYFIDKFLDPATGNKYTDKSRIFFNSTFLDKPATYLKSPAILDFT